MSKIQQKQRKVLTNHGCLCEFAYVRAKHGKYLSLITLKTPNTYLLLTEFEGRTVSYGPSFFLLDLWPNCEARGP